MPIARFLADGQFSQAQQRILEAAFNDALRRLNLVDRNDPICEIVARKVIDIGSDDSNDSISLAERVMRHFQV